MSLCCVSFHNSWSIAASDSYSSCVLLPLLVLPVQTAMPLAGSCFPPDRRCGWGRSTWRGSRLWVMSTWIGGICHQLGVLLFTSCCINIFVPNCWLFIYIHVSRRLLCSKKIRGQQRLAYVVLLHIRSHYSLHTKTLAGCRR